MIEAFHVFVNGVVGVFGVIFVLYLSIKLLSLIADRFKVES